MRDYSRFIKFMIKILSASTTESVEDKFNAFSKDHCIIKWSYEIYQYKYNVQHIIIVEYEDTQNVNKEV